MLLTKMQTGIDSWNIQHYHTCKTKTLILDAIPQILLRFPANPVLEIFVTQLIEVTLRIVS